MPEWVLRISATPLESLDMKEDVNSDPVGILNVGPPFFSRSPPSGISGVSLQKVFSRRGGLSVSVLQTKENYEWGDSPAGSFALYWCAFGDCRYFGLLPAGIYPAVFFRDTRDATGRLPMM